MHEFARATLHLYREALGSAVRSFARCWLIAVAVVVFAGLLFLVRPLAGSMGLMGGFMLGAANALVFGAALSLIEIAVRSSRRIHLEDIWGSIGSYFWDVISVGFVIWIPMMVLEQGMAQNPMGPFVTSAVFLLLFILLNPAPEVIYQVRHGSPLEVLKESYEFILENWIEWFLPLALILAPLGLTFFFAISSGVGRSAGLSFLEIVLLPGIVLATWLDQLGLPQHVSGFFGLVLTPPLAVLMLLFRGHLFAALHGSSRRQRLFKLRSQSEN